MANLVVTGSGDYVKTVFNVYGSAFGMHTGYWRRSQITNLHMASDQTYIEINILNDRKWQVTWDNNSTQFPIIDSVDGFAPTSQSDLLDKLKAVL